MLENETIIVLSTTIITLICGLIARKVCWFSNNLIPIQNICIGVVSAIIYYVYTKDISLAIGTAGLFAGGAYDVVNNIKKIINQESGVDG